jgi:hypothetical protein
MSSGNNNFQGRSSKVGKQFHKECMDLLKNLGFDYVDEYHVLHDYGVEIELIYNNRNNISLFFDASGTDEDKPASERPGFLRTDNVKKTIANGFLISRATGNPVIALTSHVPQSNSSSGKMLNAAGRHAILDVICIYDEEDVRKLQQYLNMNTRDLDELVRDDERSLFD